MDFLYNNNQMEIQQYFIIKIKNNHLKFFITTIETFILIVQKSHNSSICQLTVVIYFIIY